MTQATIPAHVQYDPLGDTLTVQFTSPAHEFHAGPVFDDAFVAFDAAELGQPALVRLRTPFWGRSAPWSAAAEQLVTRSVWTEGRRLADERTSDIVEVVVPAAEWDAVADVRAAYHTALCGQCGAVPPVARTTKTQAEVRQQALDREQPG
jgi:hypothetical protein